MKNLIGFTKFTKAVTIGIVLPTILSMVASFQAFAQIPSGTDRTPEEQLQWERSLRASSQRSTAPCPDLVDPTGCTNGDFEKGTLSGTFFQGLYGTRNGSSYTDLQCGFSDGDISSTSAHHTIVSASSQEPLGIPLSVVPPGSGGSFSLRLGNSRWNNGAEMLTKTMFVNSKNAFYSFDYAVVLQQPDGHNDDQLPTFKVRVKDDATGNYIPNLVSMGPNGQDFVIPNSSSFFSAYNQPGSNTIIRYSQWQCATIDLSSLTGRKVTIEFINADCDKGAHFAYTYLDNLCAGCNLPNVPKLTINESVTSECGNGKWCFDYSAPPTVRTIVEFEVRTTNGQLLYNKQSPMSAGGDGQACFTLTADEYNAIMLTDHSEINIVATGNFSENGVSLPTQFTGINEYPVKCPDYGFDPCCGPVSDALLAELFVYEGTGSFSDPYRMRYTSFPFFDQAMQNFFEYQKAMYPSLQSILYRYGLFEVNGSAITPVQQQLVSVSSGTISTSSFFMTELTVNQWYRITLQIYPQGANGDLSRKCKEAVMGFRVQVSTNAEHGIPELEIRSAGKSVRYPLNLGGNANR